MTSPQTSDPRPLPDSPCPHCGGCAQVFIDRLEAAGCPVDLTHACAYCEGRGSFTRPVLPRGAVRAFAVIDTSREWWADPEQLYWIVYATSASQAKMIQARNLASDLIPGRSMREVLPSLRVRRAPEQDGESGR